MRMRDGGGGNDELPSVFTAARSDAVDCSGEAVGPSAVSAGPSVPAFESTEGFCSADSPSAASDDGGTFESSESSLTSAEADDGGTVPQLQPRS